MPDEKGKGKAAAPAGAEAPGTGLARSQAAGSPAATTAAQGDEQIIELSPEMRDKLVLELRNTLARVQQGFPGLTAPGEVFKRGEAFHVTNAVTVNNFVDRVTGEEKTKHVFEISFVSGDVVYIMQNDSGPRREFASLFTLARALGHKAQAGPLKLESKDVKNINPAYIFTQQPGYSAGVL